MHKSKPRPSSPQTIWTLKLLLLIGSLAGWAASLAHAAEAPPTAAPGTAPEDWSERVGRFLRRDYMLGDWGGYRSALSERGVDFEFFYAGAVPVNLSGGLKRGAVSEGLLLMTLDLESEKLVGYEGGHLHAGSMWIHNGPAFSRNYIGDLNVVSLLDFPDSFRLWELWYEQKVFDSTLSFKAGQMAIDRDFILPELYGTLGTISFLNQTFFYPTLAFNVYDIAGFPPRHHALASTPYGAPGALIRWDPVPQFYAQAAVYDGNPDQSYSGTRVNLNDKEGALAYFELGYRLHPGEAPAGLPGVYKIGGYYHTDSFIDISEGATDLINQAIGFPAAPLEEHPGNYGVYALAEQTLFRESIRHDPARQGLVGFLRAAAAPQDRNLTELELAGGLVYTGPFPTRDYDTVGIAASYLRMSDDIRDAVKNANSLYGIGLAVPDSETVLEFSYKAQLTAWWTLQPSLQWVIHPGGRGNGQDIPDAVAFLVFTTFRL
ncbi:MAG: carbohydrate porin [Verrucomicrobiia bacterium]